MIASPKMIVGGTLVDVVSRFVKFCHGKLHFAPSKADVFYQGALASAKRSGTKMSAHPIIVELADESTGDFS